VPDHSGIVVVVDRRERIDGVPAALRALGVVIDIQTLDAGDYVVPGGTRIERKTVRDLHLTLAEGRFWTQVNRLRARCSYPILLVEGVRLDADIVDVASVRGALVSLLNRGLVVVRSENVVDSARWIRDIAHSRGHGRRRSLQRPYVAPTGERDSPAVAALCAIPDVSVVTAHALLDRFGSIRGLATATPKELRSVNGIGPQRAGAIARTLDTGRTPF